MMEGVTWRCSVQCTAQCNLHPMTRTDPVTEQRDREARSIPSCPLSSLWDVIRNRDGENNRAPGVHTSTISPHHKKVWLFTVRWSTRLATARTSCALFEAEILLLVFLAESIPIMAMTSLRRRDRNPDVNSFAAW